MTKQTYYIIFNDAWGQHGTDIDRTQLTKKEFEKMRDAYPRNYFITDNYAEALYYTQD